MILNIDAYRVLQHITINQLTLTFCHFYATNFLRSVLSVSSFLHFVLQVRAASAVASPMSPLAHARVPVASNQAKYFELLARFYVLKRQHVLAAHVLVRLAERRSTDAGDAPTLEQRFLFQLT